MAGNILHSISGWYKVGLGWLVSAYSSHFIHGGGDVQAHQTQGGKLTKPSGLVMGTKGISYGHKHVQQLQVLV